MKQVILTEQYCGDIGYKNLSRQKNILQCNGNDNNNNNNEQKEPPSKITEKRK